MNPEMVSTLGFYDINELHRSQLLETAELELQLDIDWFLIIGDPCK